MDDVWGRFLGLPHDTTPAAVTTNKNIKPLAIFCSCTAWFVLDQVGNQNVCFLMTRLIYKANELGNRICLILDLNIFFNAHIAFLWERNHSKVNHTMFSLYLFIILAISHFGFEGKTLVLIAKVPGHCFADLFAF